ncbi:bacillithiol biosynthesis BshC [bacterium]|nr:bacillithiol biosynthesis BshC [bacterium]
MIAVQLGADLAHHADIDEVFRTWLAGRDDTGRATEELQDFLGGRRGGELATGAIWADAGWREAWLEDHLHDCPDDEERGHVRAAVAQLTAGAAEVVITGQQPGFLGGPLYTLYKIATAIVLAELRTAAGTPTVPVFWSGDDDDDLREALQPVAWDPARRVLLHHELRGRGGLGADRMVGTLAAAEYAHGGARWLAEQAHRNDLAHDLAAIWDEAVREGRTWGQLQRRALLRVFKGRGLLIVRGDDSRMHAAAAPFYDRLWTAREDVRAAARLGGSRLEAAGFAVALGESSIQRFLHRGRDGRRQPLARDHAGSLPSASELRPGVVARSPVQDWLFRPAGVVVGPGEAAYLRQLVPVYDLLEVPRVPLLPRLVAQLGPEGYGEFRSWAMELADREPSGPDRTERDGSRRVAEAARAALRALLAEEAGVGDRRLDQLGDQVIARWARYLDGVIDREQRRQRDRSVAGQPAWLRPDGRRQERSLAAIAAAALWGDDFQDALAHAGRRHVDAGLAGDWREYLLTVPKP